jgi:hypothetical protein
MERNEWLRKDLPRDKPGLEIGPLDRPIMPRPGSGVLYADHLDREGLRHKYAAHENVHLDAIPHIDHVIGPTQLIDAIGPGRLHYVIASHVIEHVPNPIAWLLELHDMLVDGGTIALAVPDRRQCFDSLRRESIAADWIEAYLLGHTRPSPARIFDALSQEVKLDGAISWHHSPDPLQLKLSRTANHAYEITRRVLETGEYFDVHCWTFTPETFANLMRTVVSLGLIRLQLVEFVETRGNEFLVKLRRQDSLAISDHVCSYPARGGRYTSLPRNFDALTYIRLNPDVANAGVDPYEHYLEYGRTEGRRFR